MCHELITEKRLQIALRLNEAVNGRLAEPLQLSTEDQDGVASSKLVSGLSYERYLGLFDKLFLPFEVR
jgi:hypothetical protein